MASENKIKQLGEDGYVNQNCWLARNLNYPPTRHCQFCQSKLRSCLFERYMVITFVLVVVVLLINFIWEKTISKSLVFSIFTIIIVYGYYFSKSTEKMIVANFDEKKAKDAFKKLSSELQEKVDNQTKDLKKAFEVERSANADLEYLSKAKDQFLLTIQHHLRTPLTVMKGCTEMLLDGSCGKQNMKSMGIILRFKKSTDKLVKMVNEFLDITQFQVGKQIIAPQENVNINAIISDILEELKMESDRKGISLNFDNSKEFFAKVDPEKLKAALYNIFDNAVKYTPKGSVNIKMELKDKSNLLIICEDTGIGMTEEEKKNLFEHIFERGKEAQKTFAVGRGLGMFISYQIVKAHKGDIRAESLGKDKGSTFYIELPII